MCASNTSPDGPKLLTVNFVRLGTLLEPEVRQLGTVVELEQKQKDTREREQVTAA